ncbi:ABC transporter permease [Nocardiopsis coralliicola]
MTTATRPMPARDTATMLRRNLKRLVRYPSVTLLLIGMPVVFLLMFTYIFGGSMGAGLSGPAASLSPGDARAEYVTYLAPGLLVMTVASVAQGTSITVAMDMTTGVVARFRTMAIARTSVLSGHVLAAVAQTAIAVAVVLAVALLIGFRSPAGPAEWLGVAGVLALVTFAFTWLSTALGLVARNVETASNTPMVLILLPFVSSAFVPTDSLPTAVRWFAEYQPFTPVIESIRGLLQGTGADGSLWLAVAWCGAITAAGYLWSKRLYNRDPSA